MVDWTLQQLFSYNFSHPAALVSAVKRLYLSGIDYGRPAELIPRLSEVNRTHPAPSTDSRARARPAVSRSSPLGKQIRWVVRQVLFGSFSVHFRRYERNPSDDE